MPCMDERGSIRSSQNTRVVSDRLVVLANRKASMLEQIYTTTFLIEYGHVL